jgi:peptidoglycan/xylan/chitin deacetylase (PgdA/CDA1 family)
MSRLAWSTAGAAIGLSLIVTLAEAGPSKTQLLLSVIGVYIALLVVGSLSPRLDFYLPSARRGPVDQPWIALTFDDGPDPALTPALLKLLRRERIPAAFFCVGAAARRYPALITQAAADGHLIGNHSDRHGYGWTVAAPSQVLAEFAAANQTLAAILGAAPRFVRTPSGVSRPDLAEAFAQLQLTNVAWDVCGLELLYPQSSPHRRPHCPACPQRLNHPAA